MKEGYLDLLDLPDNLVGQVTTVKQGPRVRSDFQVNGVFQDQQDPKVNVGAQVGLARKASREISVSGVTLVNQESPGNLGDQGLQVHMGIKAQQVLQDHLASGEKKESREPEVSQELWGVQEMKGLRENRAEKGREAIEAKMALQDLLDLVVRWDSKERGVKRVTQGSAVRVDRLDFQDQMEKRGQ